MPGQLPTCSEDHKLTEIPKTQNHNQLVKLFPESNGEIEDTVRLVGLS